MVDFVRFVELSDIEGIAFISDSAESLGAIYKYNKVGSQALAHSFSFFANKNITTGEGGMVTTNSNQLAEKLRIIRNQGQVGRYNHIYHGQNFRMTDVLASIGIEQLKKIDFILKQKQKLAQRYNKAFKNYMSIKRPYVPDYVKLHSWYNYSIMVDPKIRDGLIKYLDTISDTEIVKLNIPTGIPLVYELDNNFNANKNYYLGNYDIESKINEIKAQGNA